MKRPTDDFLEAEAGLARAEQRQENLAPWLHRRRLAMHSMVSRGGGMAAVRHRTEIEALRAQVQHYEAVLDALAATSTGSIEYWAEVARVALAKYRKKEGNDED